MKVSKRRQDVHGEIVTSPSVSFLSFEKALEVFLEAQDASQHSRETRKDYNAVVGIFIRYAKDVLDYSFVQQVTEADLLKWMAYLRNTNSTRGRPYSSRTVETYFRDVSVFFTWLFNHKYLTLNPLANIKRPKTEKTLIRVFSEEELKRLDNACERNPSARGTTEDEKKMLASRDRAILWLLLSTGLRISETCGLLFSDVDWDNSMIYVRGKGAKERKVPFGKVARQHLKTYITYWRGPYDIHDHVFTNLWGKPFLKTSAQDMFERLKKVAGIADKRVSAHTCRHWFAVNAIKQGMPTVVLKGLLGHENWDMIEVYVRLAEQDNKELYMRFSPVDNLNMHSAASKSKRNQVREWHKSHKHSNEE